MRLHPKLRRRSTPHAPSHHTTHPVHNWFPTPIDHGVRWQQARTLSSHRPNSGLAEQAELKVVGGLAHPLRFSTPRMERHRVIACVDVGGVRLELPLHDLPDTRHFTCQPHRMSVPVRGHLVRLEDLRIGAPTRRSHPPRPSAQDRLVTLLDLCGVHRLKTAGPSNARARGAAIDALMATDTACVCECVCVCVCLCLC